MRYTMPTSASGAPSFVNSNTEKPGKPCWCRRATNQPADSGQCYLSAKHALYDSQSGVKVLVANRVFMVHA